MALCFNRSTFNTFFKMYINICPKGNESQVSLYPTGKKLAKKLTGVKKVEKS